MAFLKSSQLSLGPKTVDVKGFTQATSLKLGDRAYTEHEVLLADNYNIVGDVTVNDDLIISKLSDDGNAITITGDTTTRTITGSGSIEGATLAQTPNATLTGMTGVLGSAVTGGGGLTSLGTVTSGTLGSGVTFARGAKLLQVKRQLSGTYATTSGWGASGLSTYTYTSRSVSIIPISTTSTIYGQALIACGSDFTATTGPQHYYIILRALNYNNGDPVVSTNAGGYINNYFGRSSTMRFDDYHNLPMMMVDTAHGQGNGGSVIYRLYFKNPGNGNRGSGFDMMMWEVEE